MQVTDVGRHGMVVVGTETLYASHIPSLMTPNDYQIILEVVLDTDAYHSARARFGTSALLTLRSGPFSTQGLQPVADAPPDLAEFPAELFFGHFERGGDSLGPVTVEVQRTLVFRHLDPSSKSPQLNYILFGRGPDLFLTHKTTAAPDFDQILTAQVLTEGSGPPPGRTVNLNIPGRKNGLDNRLLPGEQATASVTGDDIRTISEPPSPPATLGLQVLAEVYLESF